MNEKEDDTVEDLALTLEDATEALAALDIEGWEGSFQVSSTHHYCWYHHDYPLKIPHLKLIPILFTPTYPTH
jgi:hypothetical protein